MRRFSVPLPDPIVSLCVGVCVRVFLSLWACACVFLCVVVVVVGVIVVQTMVYVFLCMRGKPTGAEHGLGAVEDVRYACLAVMHQAILSLGTVKRL